MQSADRVLHTALYNRLTSLLGSVPVRFEGGQAASADYVQISTSDETPSVRYQDKDGSPAEIKRTFSFWGSNPLTLTSRAQTVIDDLNSNVLSVTGFVVIEQRLELNRSRHLPSPTSDTLEHVRDVRWRFVLSPSP